MTSESSAPEDQSPAVEGHPILSALSKLPEEERTQVLALIYQQITHSAPAVSETVAMLEMLPGQDRRRFLDELIADGALDRETRRRNTDEDIEDCRAARRNTSMSLWAGWLIVAGSLLGAGNRSLSRSGRLVRLGRPRCNWRGWTGCDQLGCAKQSHSSRTGHAARRSQSRRTGLNSIRSHSRDGNYSR